MPQGCGDGSAQSLLLSISFTFFQEKGQGSPHHFSGFTLTGKPKPRISLVRKKEAMLMLPEMGKLLLFLTKLLRTLVFPMSEQSHRCHCVPGGQTLSQTHCHQPCCPSQAFRDPWGDACSPLPTPTWAFLPLLYPLCSSLPKGCLTGHYLAKVNFKPKRRNKFETEYYCTQSQNISHKYLGAPVCPPFNNKIGFQDSALLHRLQRLHPQIADTRA